MRRREFVLGAGTSAISFSLVGSAHRAFGQGWEFVAAYGPAILGAVGGAVLEANSPDRNRWLRGAMAQLNLSLDQILLKLAELTNRLAIIALDVEQIPDDVLDKFIMNDVGATMFFVERTFASYSGDYENENFISDMQQVYFDARKLAGKVRAQEFRIAPTAMLLIPLVISSGLNSSFVVDESKKRDIRGNVSDLMAFLRQSIDPALSNSLFGILETEKERFRLVDEQLKNKTTSWLEKWGAGSIRVVYRVDFNGNPDAGFNYGITELLLSRPRLPEDDPGFAKVVHDSGLPDVDWVYSGKDTDAFEYSRGHAEHRLREIYSIIPTWKNRRDKLAEVQAAFDMVTDFLKKAPIEIEKL